MKKEIRIEGMSCEHCVKRVRKVLSELEGVKNIEIELESGIVKLESGSSVSDDVLKEVIEDAGYDVVSVESRE